MSGVNRVTLVGYLGADPEMKYVPSGQAVCQMRLATSEKWKDKEGKPQERTEWHRLVAWGKTAEICAKYLEKGRQVYIEGRLQTREWAKDDGIKRWSTEIVVNEVQFLGSGDGKGKERRDEPPPPLDPPPAQGGSSTHPDDDIPF